MKDAPFPKKALARVTLGAGGGGSKETGARTPVTDPDTIQSKAMLSILDLICEGQVKGLVGMIPTDPKSGQSSIILDGTPLANPDGGENFSGFEWDFRDGRQDQDVIKGFPAVTTPYNVGVQVKQSTPQTMTINDPDADQVRVIVSLPGLSRQDTETGDITGTEVRYMFLLSTDNGPFVPVPVDSTGNTAVVINDKSRSKYQREHLFTLPKPALAYKLRMMRLTPDSTTTALVNDTFLDSYYEIINERLYYPNSVMCGIKVTAEQFSSLPTRAYLIDGLYVRIPSNYNPETRTYTGVWDGSFKIGFTSNPAWILYDLMLSRRYGLGEFVKESHINAAKLYTIARYCDGMVDDGKGGTEPRFSINTSIASRNDAYKVISDICSTFRGMSYWSGGMVQTVQDSPTDPVYLFNNSNVVDGMFNRVGSARKDRHSVVHVQWNDPEDQYKQKIEYVEDPELILSLGYKRLDTIAFGCTSRAQAHRVGLWILYTEKVETNITSFEVGNDGMMVMPGDVVKIHDQWKAGKRNGGRLLSSTRMGCTLDKTTHVSAGSIVGIRMPNGKFEEKQVNEVGDTNVLTFVSQLSEQPMPNTVWILVESNLVPALGRVVAVAQSEKPQQYVISVVDHNPSKFASIEQGLALEDMPTTIIDPTFSTPEFLKIEEVTYLVAPGQLGSRLEVSWQGKSPTYFISYRVTSTDGVVSGWQMFTTTVAAYSVMNIEGGSVYDFKVVGRAVTGKLSAELVGTYVALGTANPPAPPTNLTAIGDFRQIGLAWLNANIVDFDYVEIWENTRDDLASAYYLDRTPSNKYIRSGIPGLMQYWYWVRTVNKRGMKSAYNSTAGVSAIAGVIAVTDLDKDLAKIIEDISGGLDGIVEEVLDRVNEVIDGLPERVSEVEGRAEEAEALAAAARAGNSIEALLRDDVDVQLKQDTYELGVTLSDDIAAKIREVNEVLVSDRQAVAQQFTVVEAKFQSSDAALVTERTARATADSAQVTSINALTVKTDATNASLVQEQTARATADSAQVTDITSLKAKTDTTNANLITEQSVRASADSAQASDITSLKAKTDTTNASLVTEATTRANADSAQSTLITSLTSKTDTTNANLATELITRANADSALSSSITALNSTVGQNTAGLATELTTRANADSALSTRIDQTVAANGANSTAIQTETTARANADYAIGLQVNQLVSKTDVTNGALQTEAQTRADRDGALTTLVTTAQSTANGAASSAQTSLQTIADTNGRLSAMWSMKVQLDVNGKFYAAGMGIGIENTGQGITQSQIAMQADRFVVLNPNVGTNYYPFQVIGGVVYINTAMIASATITNAMIQDASITTAKIQDAAITNAKIGAAQVDTLQLAGQAVTFPVAAQIAGTTTISQPFTWTEMVAVNHPGSGIKVVTCTAVIANNISNSGKVIDVAVLVNGAAEYYAPACMQSGTVGSFTASFTSYTPGNFQFCMRFRDVAGTGGGGYTTAFTTRTIVVMEVKR